MCVLIITSSSQLNFCTAKHTRSCLMNSAFSWYIIPFTFIFLSNAWKHLLGVNIIGTLFIWVPGCLCHLHLGLLFNCFYSWDNVFQDSVPSNFMIFVSLYWRTSWSKDECIGAHICEPINIWMCNSNLTNWFVSMSSSLQTFLQKHQDISRLSVFSH